MKQLISDILADVFGNKSLTTIIMFVAFIFGFIGGVGIFWYAYYLLMIDNVVVP